YESELVKKARQLEGKTVVVTAVVQPESERIVVTDLRADAGATGRGHPFDLRILVGLDVGKAQQIVEAKGLEFRVVMKDGVSLPITMDIRPDRVNVVVEAGEGIGASIG